MVEWPGLPLTLDNPNSRAYKLCGLGLGPERRQNSVFLARPPLKPVLQLVTS